MQRVAVVVASVPIILLPALWVVAPGYMEPLTLNPPATLGLPTGVVIVAFAGGMALFGWLVARRAQSLGVALGLAFLTIPALLLIVVTPALILSIVNSAV